MFSCVLLQNGSQFNILVSMHLCICEACVASHYTIHACLGCLYILALRYDYVNIVEIIL